MDGTTEFNHVFSAGFQFYFGPISFPVALYFPFGKEMFILHHRILKVFNLLLMLIGLTVKSLPLSLRGVFGLVLSAILGL